MDPIRRLILLGLVASVILAEPTQARALFAARSHAADRQPDTATQRFIQQLAVVLRQTVKPAAIRSRSADSSACHSSVLFCQCDAFDGRFPLLPHLSDLPPPLI